MAKKAWCCQKEVRGCPEEGGTSPPFDCADVQATLHEDWPTAKQLWCCAHERKGCPDGSAPQQPAVMPAVQAETTTTTTVDCPYYCDEGLSNWQKGWSVGKKNWCCEHEHKGCP